MSDLAGCPLRPLFPPDLRAEMPWLGAEDTNGLFDALRRRRFAHPRVRAGGTPDPSEREKRRDEVIGLVLIAASLAAGFWFQYRAAEDFAFWILPLSSVIAAPVCVALEPTPDRFGTARALVAASATRLGDRRALLEELWLAGLTGRSAVEAVELEMAQRIEELSCVVPGLLAWGVALSAWSGDPVPPLLVFWVLTGAAFLWIAQPGVRALLHCGVLRLLASEVRWWAAGPQLQLRAWRRHADRMRRVAPLLILTWFPFVPTALLAAPLMHHWQLGAVHAWLALTAVLLLFAVVLRLWSPIQQRRNDRRRERLRADADDAFRTFFHRLVMEDPDA